MNNAEISDDLDELVISNKPKHEQKREDSDLEELEIAEIPKEPEKPKRKNRKSKVRAPPPKKEDEEISAQPTQPPMLGSLVREDTVLFPGK